MELSKVNRGTASTRQGELSKKSKIVLLLAHLGVRRQAKLDTEDYLVFAADLESYEIADIEAAMKALYSKPRAEGETAFPDVATILEAVRGVIRARRPSAEQEAADKWNRYLEACKAEGVEAPDPEMAARIAKLNARLSL